MLIRFDVHGQMDMVTADLRRSGDVASLDRAIGIMQKLREGLINLYHGRNDPGSCFEQGDRGRCYGELAGIGPAAPPRMRREPDQPTTFIPPRRKRPELHCALTQRSGPSESSEC